MNRLAVALLSLLLLAPAHASEAQKTAFTICNGSDRHDCIVDGDTLWVGREKIRLYGIDAPEMAGRSCAVSGDRAKYATFALWALMQRTPIYVKPRGKDRYGRTLAEISAGGVDVALELVDKGFARPYLRGEKPWCG